MSRERFTEMVREAIVSLPQDLKAFLRIVDDPEVDDESRVAAAGALLHVLSGANAIPGMRGILAYVDDVLVLRLVLERIGKRSPEAVGQHRASAPELFEPLDQNLSVAREYLDDLIVVLDQAASAAPSLSHLGHNAKQCVYETDSSNWLYDAVQEAIVDQLEFDDEEIVREVKSVDKILPHLKSRVDAAKSAS